MTVSESMECFSSVVDAGSQVHFHSTTCVSVQSIVHTAALDHVLSRSA